MSLDEIGERLQKQMREDRPFSAAETPEDQMTPARRAALAALEREFRDLLAPRP